MEKLEKMRMESTDLYEKNLKRLYKLFPSCFTEVRLPDGAYTNKVNYDKLKELLGEGAGPKDEVFEFTWVGKQQSLREASLPIRMTLRPQIEKSVSWDTTGNIYIEGDNLEAIKLLQESYLEGIKLIYIDPPYNTGNDFIYNDSFKESVDDYDVEAGMVNEDGERMVLNPESSGRFHSKWCSMMYPRLLLARNLLSQDGVIFISIDDNEIEHLKMMCNEIFGKQNFEGHIHWRRRHNQPNDKTKMIGIVTEHILVYAKDSVFLKQVGVGKLDLTATFTNADNDPKGPWASKPWKTGSDQGGSRYKIITPTGKVLDEEWMGDESTYKKYLEEGRMYFPKGGDGMPRKKYYQFEREDEGQCAINWWSHEQFGHNQGANDCMTRLFGVKNVFSNPKPIELLRAIMKVANVHDDDVVLDFFSGSASTAHALMKLNAETNGRRRFILIQALEKCDGKSVPFKEGFSNICEIGEERIRRAANEIRNDTGAGIDYGFRVFKVDTTNMRDVYYSADDYSQDLVAMLESNIKGDRTDLDLLFGCLLEWGLPLSLPYSSETIDGCTVHTYNDGDLIACFDENISKTVVEAIAKRQPLRAVFRDSSFRNSPAKINVGEIFKFLAPDTRVKVI